MTAQLPSSKEQLLADIAHAEEKAKTLCGPCADDHARLAGYLRALLAAHEQEPVAYMYRDNLHTDARFSMEPRFGNWSPEDISEYEISETPLYTHPAPVPAVQLSPDIEYMTEDAECLAMNLDKHNVPKEKDGQELSLWGRVMEFCNQQAPVPAVSTREKLAALQLASIINDIGLPENAPFVEITSEIFRLKQLESPAPAVPDIDTWRTAFEYSERQRDEGFNLHKFGTGYADDATQKRWESWLSSRAAMLNGGTSLGSVLDRDFSVSGLISTSDPRKMEMVSDDETIPEMLMCGKHPYTPMRPHPYEMLLSCPPKPRMYCPDCEPLPDAPKGV